MTGSEATRQVVMTVDGDCLATDTHVRADNWPGGIIIIVIHHYCNAPYIYIKIIQEHLFTVPVCNLLVKAALVSGHLSGGSTDQRQ